MSEIKPAAEEWQSFVPHPHEPFMGAVTRLWLSDGFEGSVGEAVEAVKDAIVRANLESARAAANTADPAPQSALLAELTAAMEQAAEIMRRNIGRQDEKLADVEPILRAALAKAKELGA